VQTCWKLYQVDWSRDGENLGGNDCDKRWKDKPKKAFKRSLLNLIHLTYKERWNANVKEHSPIPGHDDQH